MRLKDKTAVVVGAGQTSGETMGNGRATALLFAREGARVACVDRNREAAEETARMIAEEGGQACVIEADIGYEHHCQDLIGEAARELGRIDILHNNVGIGTDDAPVHQLTETAWDRIMNANLKGMWLTIKHALPVMRAQKHGVIVNISSLAAIAPAGITAYEISKAGVNKLTQTVAAANARHGIRCNAIMPGLMDTPMAVEAIAARSGKSSDEVREQRSALVPLGRRMGTAWDTAYAALFLASDEAGFVTGAVIPVDGGLSVRAG